MRNQPGRRPVFVGCAAVAVALATGLQSLPAEPATGPASTARRDPRLDVAEKDREDRAADARYAAATAVSPLPSGRDGYRQLPDYEKDFTALAKRYPRLVRPIRLPYRSVEGRSVRGIEITTDAANVNDGKPVFLLLGIHHAREWPAGETALEYAFDLLRNYGLDERITSIVRTTRTIVVPVVNPDGFVVSRQAPPMPGFDKFNYSMKRKACDTTAQTLREERGGSCADNPQGVERGTDPNRNYPGFWGGPGGEVDYRHEGYRGDSPGVLPEVKNVRWLVSNRQVTNLITLHTFGNMIMRPPGVSGTGAAPDEPAYRALGASMAAANRYLNIPVHLFLPVSGATEDWSYWNTGGLGFTFEIGSGFHPQFTEVIAQYLGSGSGGNREALLRMSEATANEALHSTIAGTTAPGRRLTITKTFQTPTAPIIQPDGSTTAPINYSDRLTSTLTTRGGAFRWAVNPSTRPYVAGRWGRDPVAPTQLPITVINPPGTPPTGGGSEVATFTIEKPPTADNGKATVTVGWDKPGGDWDAYVIGPDGELAGRAATPGSHPEIAVLVDPVPGTYQLYVENWSENDQVDWRGTVEFAPHTPASYTGVKESWNLSCHTLAGRLLATRQVTVDRGHTAQIGDPCLTGAAGQDR